MSSSQNQESWKIGPKRATIGTCFSHTLGCLQMGAAAGKVAHVNLSKLTPTTLTNLIWFLKKFTWKQFCNEFCLDCAFAS